MHRMLQKRQPPLASFRAAISVAWVELCLWRHERLAAVRLLPQVCIGRRMVALTCGRPISCAGAPREERSWVALCTSHEDDAAGPTRKPICLPIGKLRVPQAGKEPVVSCGKSSSRTCAAFATNGLRGRDGRHLQLFTADDLRLLEEAKNFVSARCPRPHLRRDRAHSQHIFATGVGALLPHLQLGVMCAAADGGEPAL
jgi:hypothetical protein